MNDHSEQLDQLRRRLTELTDENAQLKGRGPTSRGDVEMVRHNTDLRRRVEHLRRRLPAPTLGGRVRQEYLTVHQAASRLNVTAGEVSRLLDRVETRRDDNDVEIVAADRFDQFILDTAKGRNPSRFL